MSKIVWYIAMVALLVILLAIGLTVLSMWIWPVEAQQLPSGASIILHKLTGPDKQVIYLNPLGIIALRAPRSTDSFGPEIHCVISTSDGKFVAVVEPCDTFIKSAEPSK